MFLLTIIRKSYLDSVSFLDLASVSSASLPQGPLHVRLAETYVS